MKETGKGGFQQKVIDQLKSQAVFIFNVHGHRGQRSGLPDLLVIHTKWKGWLELKCEKYKASSLQRIQAAKIELREMPVYVLRCVEHFPDINEVNVNTGISGTYCEYTLENFQGGVIKTFDDLGSLLWILIDLEGRKWNEG